MQVLAHDAQSAHRRVVASPLTAAVLSSSSLARSSSQNEFIPTSWFVIEVGISRPKPSGILVGTHRIKFHVNKLSDRSAVTPPCGEQRFRFLQTFGLDPPVFDARNQHRRMECLGLELHF
jgi:hypothetical protein